MQALGYETNAQLSDGVKMSAGKKDGYLMWSEFLDFFFLESKLRASRQDEPDHRQQATEDEHGSTDGAAVCQEREDRTGYDFRRAGIPGAVCVGHPCLVQTDWEQIKEHHHR